MSLILDCGTLPKGTEVKSFLGAMLLMRGPGIKEEIEISPIDMRCMVQYWLTNTDLEKNDERVKLAVFVKELVIGEGFDPAALRLGAIGEFR